MLITYLLCRVCVGLHTFSIVSEIETMCLHVSPYRGFCRTAPSVAPAGKQWLLQYSLLPQSAHLTTGPDCRIDGCSSGKPCLVQPIIDLDIDEAIDSRMSDTQGSHDIAYTNSGEDSYELTSHAHRSKADLLTGSGMIGRLTRQIPGLLSEEVPTWSRGNITLVWRNTGNNVPAMILACLLTWSLIISSARSSSDIGLCLK